MTGCTGPALAAGAGGRYGQPKATVIVVLGAWRGEVPAAEIVVNEDWADGLGSSLRAGLAALQPRIDVSSVVITLVDLPGLTGAAVRRVVDASGDIVVATYNSERGHPVRFARQHRDAVVADIADGRDMDRPTPTSAPPR